MCCVSIIPLRMFTLRNGISWDLISCSTFLIVLLSEVMSFSKSSILSFIISLFWSFSCFSMESLDASSSRRNWCSASNSSRICLSVFSAWLCNENVIIYFFWRGEFIVSFYNCSLACLSKQIQTENTLTCSIVCSQVSFAFWKSFSFSWSGFKAFLSSSYKEWIKR